MTGHSELSAEHPPTSGQKMPVSNLLDIGSGVGLAVGSIASLVSQNVAFAAFPISLSIALQIANRQRLATESLTRHNLDQGAIGQLAQHMERVQNQVADRLQQSQTETEQQFAQQRLEQQAELAKLAERFEQVDGEIAGLTDRQQAMNGSLENLGSEQQKIAALLPEMRLVANYTQALQSNPNDINLLFRRGMSHLTLGDRDEAIADFTAVLKKDLGHAGAYHQRGILQAEAGNRKQAVEDLRLASKYYFEQGDLENYQITRDLSKEGHDLRSAPEEGVKGETANLAIEERGNAPGTIPIAIPQEEISADSLFG